MICWRSCSISAAALIACACASGGKPLPPRGGRIAVLPPSNQSGIAVPLKEVRAALVTALRQQGVEMVPDTEMEAFMARMRVRYTGGVDRELALAAESQLGVDGLFVTTVELYHAEQPPKLGITARFVLARGGPSIAWIDGAATAGDESPGAFDLGIVTDVQVIEKRLFAKLAASFARWRAGGPNAVACSTSGRFAPRSRYRSPVFDRSKRQSVAVLPFLNETARRSAGELVALQFVRQLEASGRFRVIEPGVVRDELLRYRIVTESGISLDVARVVSELLRADLVVAGYVRDYDEAGVAKVGFTVLVLERNDNQIVWQSTSHARGDDRVFFFDAGLVSNASELCCRMVRGVVDAMGSD